MDLNPIRLKDVRPMSTETFIEGYGNFTEGDGYIIEGDGIFVEGYGIA